MRQFSNVRILAVIISTFLESKVIADTAKLGIEYHIVHAVSDIPNMVIKNKYNAVLIDLDLLRSTDEGTQLIIERFMKLFPFASVSYAIGDREMEMFENGALGRTSFYDFIKKISNLQQRKFRDDNYRKKLNLNVTLYRENRGVLRKIQRSHTLNVSRGGCFIHTYMHFKAESIIYIVIDNLIDKTIIETRIAWTTKGDTKKVQLAGIGLEFKKLTDEQRGELLFLIDSNE